MKQFSSLDLHYLVKEFKILENQRIETFYLENSHFYMKCYVKGTGHFFVTSEIGKYIYLDSSKPPSSTHPHNFAQYLRKHLKNAFIRKIEQLEGERILKFVISKKEGENIYEYTLFIELFGIGNIVLTDNNLIIKNSLTKKTFKDRTIKVSQKYELPPKKLFSFSNLDAQRIEKEMRNSDMSLVKFLAIQFGIGGKYAEEVVLLSKIDKNLSVNQLTNQELQTVITSLQFLVEHEIDACMYVDENENLKDVAPFELESVKLKLIKTKSFNEAVKTYIQQFKEKRDDQKEKEFLKELKKLEKRLEKQEEQKQVALQEYEINNETGNKIYEHYAIVEDLLREINKAAKSKGWKYVQEKVKQEEQLSSLVKKINQKNNEIIVELK